MASCEVGDAHGQGANQCKWKASSFCWWATSAFYGGEAIDRRPFSEKIFPGKGPIPEINPWKSTLGSGCDVMPKYISRKFFNTKIWKVLESALGLRKFIGLPEKHHSSLELVIHCIESYARTHFGAKLFRIWFDKDTWEGDFQFMYGILKMHIIPFIFL